MNRKLVLTAAAALIAAATLHQAPARADAPSSSGTLGSCVMEGTALPTPGLRFTPRRTTIDLDVHLISCITDDPTIGSATSEGSASSASLGCMGGRFTGEQTFTWSNGATSTVSTESTAVGPVVITTGTVIRGTAFVGARLVTVAQGLFTPDSLPTHCATTAGLPVFRFVGTATILPQGA